MEAHTHTVFGNFCGKYMIENIIRDSKKSITPIHGITMPKDRLPDLTLYYRILQRLETQLRHDTSSRSSVLRQIMAAQSSCLMQATEFLRLQG
jgi:hypothetical protein